MNQNLIHIFDTVMDDDGNYTCEACNILGCTRKMIYLKIGGRVTDDIK